MTGSPVSIRSSIVLAVALLAASCGPPGSAGPGTPGTARDARERVAGAPTSGEHDRRMRQGGRPGRTPHGGRTEGGPRPGRPRLPAGRTVGGAIERSLLAGRISRASARSYMRTQARARAALRRLGGQRRAELATVLATLDAAAAAGELSSDRLPAALLTVRRNVDTWTRDAMPKPGERRAYGRDPLVFQYYAGRGMQLHPLGSFGRANALTGACTAERRARDRHARQEAARAVLLRRVGEPFHRRAVELRGPRCRRRALTRLLDRLVAVSSRKRGFRAWEYQFAYGGGRALWVSGMAQATGVQALARASAALERPDWMRAAHEALGAFEQPPPVGIRVPSGPGVHYLLYSFAPDLRIFNGFLQAVSGLHDMAQLSGSPRARRLYAAGERAAREAVAVYDTGAWSLYSAGGAEATLNYHVLVRDLARGLCDRTRRREWCAAGRRFARYLVEPPGLRVVPPRRPRAGRDAPIVVVVDRSATVSLRISGRSASAHRRLELPRGRHVLPWHPARRGRHRVSLAAVSRSGRRAARTLQVVVAPRPERRPKRDTGDPAGRRPKRDAADPAARRPKRGSGDPAGRRQDGDGASRRRRGPTPHRPEPRRPAKPDGGDRRPPVEPGAPFPSATPVRPPAARPGSGDPADPRRVAPEPSAAAP